MSIQKYIVLTVFLSFCLSLPGWAQLQFFPVGKQQQKQRLAKKRLSENKIFNTLPFFEDFSRIALYPDTSKWQVDETTPYVSAGFGLEPPSIYMATFDGAKANGQRYNESNPFASGEADALTSVFFDLSEMSPADSLYFSFYWQAEGLGEKPSDNDILRLQFQDRNGNWNTIWQQNGDTTTVIFPFENELVALEDTAAFHENFAFRFQSLGKLTGGFDTWNLDYIFFHKKGQRIGNDLAMSDKATSLLKNYYAMPMRQFRPNELADTVYSSVQNNSDSLHIFAPTLRVRNLYTNNNLGQYAVQAIGNFPFQPGDTTFIIDVRENMDLIALKNNDIIPAEADSLNLEYSFYFDRIPAERFYINGEEISENLPTFYNDTLRTRVLLKDYYAYDDGVAEYVVGIFQNFGQVAYRFVLNEPDYITAVDMYFPQIGDDLRGRSFNLLVWDKLDFDNTDNDQIASRLSVPFVYPDSINAFRRIELREPVFLEDTFYVGYEQLSDEPLLVGWDKNTNTADNIFFNVNAAWEQNNQYSGSMMIRPVFDLENPVNTIDKDLQTLQNVKVYPNPATDLVYIEGDVDSFQLVDITGKQIIKGNLKGNKEHYITLSPELSGLYLLILRKNQAVSSKKVLVD